MIPEINLKDLMLRKDVIEAVKKGKFHIYAVKTIDEGIEILTGKTAGALRPDRSYPYGTINYLVNAKLKNLAEGANNFSKDEGDNRSNPQRKRPLQRNNPENFRRKYYERVPDHRKRRGRHNGCRKHPQD
jgi:hypothetical protein